MGRLKAVMIDNTIVMNSRATGIYLKNFHYAHRNGKIEIIIRYDHSSVDVDDDEMIEDDITNDIQPVSKDTYSKVQYFT